MVFILLKREKDKLLVYPLRILFQCYSEIKLRIRILFLQLSKKMPKPRIRTQKRWITLSILYHLSYLYWQLVDTSDNLHYQYFITNIILPIKFPEGFSTRRFWTQITRWSIHYVIQKISVRVPFWTVFRSVRKNEF